MKEILMLIYAGIMLFVLFFGAKIKKHVFNEEPWSLSQAKCLQAIAAIMIILHHCVQTITENGRVYKGLITEWNSFGILFTSIFFFFSGYGLYAGYKNREGKYDFEDVVVKKDLVFIPSVEDLIKICLLMQIERLQPVWRIKVKVWKMMSMQLSC